MADALLPRVLSVGLLAALVLTACGSADVSRGRVEAAVGATFGELYSRSATVGTAQTGSSATCTRTRPGQDAGAGDDWRCTLSWVDAAGGLRQAAFGLQVKPDGCYKADAEAQGLAPVLREFDGCTGEG